MRQKIRNLRALGLAFRPAVAVPVKLRELLFAGLIPALSDLQKPFAVLVAIDVFGEHAQLAAAGLLLRLRLGFRQTKLLADVIAACFPVVAREAIESRSLRDPPGRVSPIGYDHRHYVQDQGSAPDRLARRRQAPRRSSRLEVARRSFAPPRGAGAWRRHWGCRAQVDGTVGGAEQEGIEVPCFGGDGQRWIAAGKFLAAACEQTSCGRPSART